MLYQQEQDRITRQFAVYEHEWRFFAGFMGEPFLINECLVYCDGSTVNVCAFPIDDCPKVLQVSDIERMLDDLSRLDSIQLVHVWGVFRPTRSITLNGRTLELVNSDSCEENYTGEYTIDLSKFDLRRQREAAKSVRSAANKGIEVRIRDIDRFEVDHYRLMEHWLNTHEIGPIAACAASTLPSYCREPDVVVAEAIYEGAIRGFEVVAHPTNDRAIRMLSFGERLSGIKIGDALTYAVIEHCVDSGVRQLHCGYAGEPALARFKEKWGAVITGPTYRQALYAVDSYWRGLADVYSFYWALRMTSSGRIGKLCVIDG